MKMNIIQIAASIAFVVVSSTFGLAGLGAQDSTGSKLSFDVTSVKIDKLGLFPAGPRQSLTANGNTFSLVNCGVYCLIGFAYNLTPDQLVDVYPQIPRDIFVERFDVDGRAVGNPNQDDMRKMVQSLLANRFMLAAHYEMRDKPIYNLVVAKPGKLGHWLRAYSTGEEPCVEMRDVMQTTQIVNGGFPAGCGNRSLLPVSKSGYFREGGRNMTIAQISSLFRVYGHLDRALVDQTGLSGTYDYIIEWDQNTEGGPAASDSAGPTFLEALQDQLGLKLDAATASIKTFVIDHIEQPTPN